MDDRPICRASASSSLQRLHTAAEVYAWGLAETRARELSPAWAHWANLAPGLAPDAAAAVQALNYVEQFGGTTEMVIAARDALAWRCHLLADSYDTFKTIAQDAGAPLANIPQLLHSHRQAVAPYAIGVWHSKSTLLNLQRGRVRPARRTQVMP